MAKTSVNDAQLARSIEQARAAQEAIGIDNANIDKLLASGKVDFTNKDYLQYFQLTWNALDRLTTRLWEGENKAMAASAPGPWEYKGYFVDPYDLAKAVPGFDFIPGGYRNSQNYLGDAKLMAQWVGFNEREYQAYHQWVGGPVPTPQSAQAPQQGPATGGSAGYGNPGSGYGGGGGGKALAVSGGSGTKALGAPPPPPGMGGGYPPPPPMGGGYPGAPGGEMMSQNMNFFPQAEWDKAYQWSQEGGLGWDWLAPLFPMKGQFQAVTATAVEELNSLRTFKQNLMMEFQNLDMNSEEGRRKSFIITQQLQEFGSKENELMDKVMRMRNFFDENMKLLSDIRKVVVEDAQKITQNIR